MQFSTLDIVGSDIAGYVELHANQVPSFNQVEAEYRFAADCVAIASLTIDIDNYMYCTMCPRPVVVEVLVDNFVSVPVQFFKASLTNRISIYLQDRYPLDQDADISNPWKFTILADHSG